MKISKTTVIASAFLLVFSPFAKCTEESSPELTLKSPCAVLMDTGTGDVLFEKNSHETRYPSSLAKIMTLLISSQKLGTGEITEGETVCISDNAGATKGPGVWLKSGEIISVQDLIKAVTMVSANDACAALAEHISKSENEFVACMNAKAKELGMNDTEFKDCLGADESESHTTAYDIAIMSRELMNHSNIMSFTAKWIDHIRNGQTQIVNTNKLLRSYSGTLGIKTGTSQKAGSCISAAAEKNGIRFVAVIMGCENPKERNKEIQSLLDYGFSEYTLASPQNESEIPKEIKVTNGMLPCVPIIAESACKIMVSKKNSNKITSHINIPECINAPVLKNQKIGEIIYKQENKILCSHGIYAAQSVPELKMRPLLTSMAHVFFKL